MQHDTLLGSYLDNNPRRAELVWIASRLKPPCFKRINDHNPGIAAGSKIWTGPLSVRFGLIGPQASQIEELMMIDQVTVAR